MKIRYAIRGLATMGLCFISFSEAQAQIRLEKAVVSPAGGYASNGSTQVYATVAQPTTGTASNGKTVMEYGFWNTVGQTAAVHSYTAVPSAIGLSVWPNPAVAATELSVQLPTASSYAIELYDIAGKKLADLGSESHQAGRFTTLLDLSGIPSGTYFIAVRAPGSIAEQKLSIVR